MKIINEKDPNSAALAKQFLQEGKVILFATDTVYGIGVNASNEKAVEKLYQIKKRDPKKPIAIFLSNIKEAEKLFIFDEVSKEIAQKFLPGALTLVLETKKAASNILANNLNCNNDNFIGFRIVDSFFIRNLFKEFDGILAVTSANISGTNQANNFDEIIKSLPQVDLVIKGEISAKIASTVAKISNGKITILRQGPVSILT